jgi:hypothetical protein
MKILLSNPEFEELWKTYNEYLLESHGIILNFKEKCDRLNELDILSDNNPAMAYEILEIMICNGEIIIKMPNANEFA